MEIAGSCVSSYTAPSGPRKRMRPMVLGSPGPPGLSARTFGAILHVSTRVAQEGREVKKIVTIGMFILAISLVIGVTWVVRAIGAVIGLRDADSQGDWAY